MPRGLVGLVVLAVMCAAVGGAHAMSLSPDDANIVQLLQQSNDILVGHVAAVTDGIDERGIPYTEVTLDVSEAIRGGASGAYTFRQFGLLKPRLTPDGKRKMMQGPPGFPKYTEGEDLVLFLRPSAAWTGFRMPAGVTRGKFTVAAGRLENDSSNAGLFRNLNLDQSLVAEGDKRLLTTATGPVNPAAFLSFVRRAVKDQWVENGRMTSADGRGGPRVPPPSETMNAKAQPAAQAPAPAPPAAPRDPNASTKAPLRTGR